MPDAPTEPPSQWRSEHIWKMPDEVELVLIVTILLIAMFVTRRKNYSILQQRPSDPGRCQCERERILHITLPCIHDKMRIKYRYTYAPIFGIWWVLVPKTSLFMDNFHSRILAKFPFLVEMFYWAVSFFFYRLTGVMAQMYYGGTQGLWDAAQEHGVRLLEFESRLFGLDRAVGQDRWAEHRIQQWYLTGADGGDFRGLWLTILDRGYSLIHIPGTVGFIAFYYWYAPNFNRFATVRRTMTLLNLCAFLIFLLYPTMPPRFLPAEFGFVDTVNAEDAQSVWMSGKYVNKLAAMPSMHFGYAFAIGCVFIYESGFLQQMFPQRKWHILSDNEDYLTASDTDEPNGHGSPVSSTSPSSPRLPLGQSRSVVSRSLFLFFGVFYPLWILLTIVATANHYFLDAVVAMVCVLVAFLCNTALYEFLILEAWLLWLVRLEKPLPTTGVLRRKLSSPS